MAPHRVPPGERFDARTHPTRAEPGDGPGLEELRERRVAFAVVAPRNSPGKRTVTVRAYARDRTGPEPVSGAVYALCRA